MRFSLAFKRNALRLAAIATLAMAGAAVPTIGYAQGEELPQVVDLAQLLEAFASMPGLEAEFVEEKQLGMLAMPLTSSGTLYFTQPGLLHRSVVSPRPSTVVITPESLRFSDEAGSEVIDLRAREDVRLFVESLVWVLAGNQAELERVYASQFESADSTWSLTLTPRESPLSDIIATMVINGQGLGVNTIEVTETAGDVTTTRISSANPSRTFDDAERAELFGVSAQ